MKNCPECSAVLDDSVLRCPYCGSDKPARMDFSQSYSLSDNAALTKARIALVIAVIALVINPFFITSLIASNSSNKVNRYCNHKNTKVLRLCSAASALAGIAIVTSTVIFFGWFIGAVAG